MYPNGTGIGLRRVRLDGTDGAPIPATAGAPIWILEVTGTNEVVKYTRTHGFGGLWRDRSTIWSDHVAHAAA